MYQCKNGSRSDRFFARERTVPPAAAGGVFARESRERTKLGVCDQRSVVSILFLTSHVSRLISHFSHLISHFSRPFCTGVPACFSQGGRSGFGCVSPAFRPRFACEWNAELTISKRVIGIFRPRFACLQNRIFLLLALPTCPNVPGRLAECLTVQRDMEVTENRAVSVGFLPCPADFQKNLIPQCTFGERLGFRPERATEISPRQGRFRPQPRVTPQ